MRRAYADRPRGKVRKLKMETTTALALGIAVSLLLSALLAFVILAPVRAVLERACPTGVGLQFWTRFIVLMLFLGPLTVTLLFGVPTSNIASRLETTDVIVRIATAALIGSLLTLGGIGLRLGTLRAPISSPPARTGTDDNWVK